MQRDHSNSNRRRYQFSLGALFAVTTWVAIYLAVERLDRTVTLPVWLAATLLPVALTLAFALVVILGTGVVLAYLKERSWMSRVGRGSLVGACISGVTVGWVAVNVSSDITGIHPLLVLTAVIVGGTVLGSLGGIIAPLLRQAIHK